MEFSDQYFRFSLGNHHEKEVIWIEFDKNNDLIQFLRQNTRARWSAAYLFTSDEEAVNSLSRLHLVRVKGIARLA